MIKVHFIKQKIHHKIRYITSLAVLCGQMFSGKNSVSGSALDFKNITLVYLKAPSVLDRVTKVQRHKCEEDILETKSDSEFHHDQKLISICYQVFYTDF